ncbi:heavy-metal-associated domain-containing protein [Agromyces intestinalis]|uniref:Heavy-metal-associated domain-containing protein n=1 Tax=Agromyces intestinalis TaxID=2592652 RepID=A0A5C1YH76_9MICO|nr:cation transporter [Agromyces intestinalis]QEO14449.1 heavy-metal-associated domain-containing protein [Agromyces intestinalis]
MHDLGLIAKQTSDDGCACCAPATGTTSAAVASATDAATDAPVAEFGVAGMTCSHCVGAVTGELTALEGVTDVSIELVAGGVSRVRVSAERALTADEIAAAVDEAGYDVAELPA